MNRKNRVSNKALARTVAVGVGIGVIAWAVKTFLDVDPFGTIIVGALVYAAWMTFRTAALRREMNASVRLLGEGRIDEYVAVCEKLLPRAEQPGWRFVAALNLSAGYHRQGRYADALRVLDEAPQIRLRGAVETVYYNNYAASLFRAGRVQEAVAFLAGHEDTLGASARNIMYLENLQDTRAWLLAGKGQTAEARALIAELRRNGNSVVQESLDALEAWMNSPEGQRVQHAGETKTEERDA